MVIQSLAGEWQFREAGTAKWLSAQVPGSVHTDLLALGRIPAPFVADNELDVQWVTERDWEYALAFQISPELLAEERVFLVCDGLDTLADVTFDGQPLGRAENMFRRYCWDVAAHLVEGDNRVHIVFPALTAYIRARQAEQPLVSPSHSIPGGPHARKAPCQFGWDWGPKLPPVGIWQDIRLEGYSVARLDDVHLRQRHADDGAVTVSADVTIERWQDADLRVVLRLTAPGGETQTETRGFGRDQVSGAIEINVAAPQLWWPNGYGEQPLYDVQVALYQGDTLCDQRAFQLGLRTLELRREPDEFGTSFTFVVNGVPLFAKGANWIPADSFPTRIDDEHLESLIRSTAQVHMNMLRVWGGGFYEEERFYDLCDRYGILVWQDFIFSCSIYPADEAFFENVRVEAVENVRRLRHRASLALWCGNNEMEWGWVNWGWQGASYEPLRRAYDRMFHHFLPEICAVEDPDRPYWPSSPSSNTPFVNPNSVRAGDTHNWEVWHGNRPFQAYREHNSRFVSEFGFQSLPALETIRTYADEADWNMTSYIMEHHQRNAAGNGKIINYMTDHFRLPKDFESLVYLTQLLQAECVRTGVEYWRRNRCTSGALYWQLNDCWPVASWASLDYYGRWKALHYAARRFYAPVLLSAEDWPAGDDDPDHVDPADDGQRRIRWSLEMPDGRVLNTGEHIVSVETAMQILGGGGRPAPAEWKPVVSLYVTNDLTDAWQGHVRWSLETLDGQALETGDEAVTAPALSAIRVRTLDFTDQVTTDNRRQVVLVYELWQDDRPLSLSVIPFAPNKHLELGDPGLRHIVHQTAEGFEIQVTARRLARFVGLALEGADAVFSDNYFDLPAGRAATVQLPALDGWTVERVRGALRLRSLADSF
jgi:beta-mannosidase